ncbi:MAG: hypothetical protein CL878_01015 [Dehalococcoidia bacterium]|nr:hypothetical protein [Dehalococcoidia bacterium]
MGAGDGNHTLDEDEELARLVVSLRGDSVDIVERRQSSVVIAFPPNVLHTLCAALGEAGVFEDGAGWSVVPVTSVRDHTYWVAAEINNDDVSALADAAERILG